MFAIETRGLTKDYPIGFWRKRPHRALDPLDLQIERGEVFGFLGPNGAGKTTTLKLLMQLIYPTAGSAEILGRPVGDTAVKRRLGYLPENPYFYDYLTAEELLSYFARLFGYAGPEQKRRVSRLLDQVGIGPERRMPLRKFSKGMLQRIGIAQAILNDPEVVFFDEPMSGLDPLGRREVRSLILALRDRGATVFFSSHILADAEALCSRVAILARGRLVSAGRLTDLLAFEVKGWELVIAGVGEAAEASLRERAARVTRIAEDRYAIEIPGADAPEGLVRDLIGSGARLVSLNPVRPTLEDFFVERVAQETEPRSGRGINVQSVERATSSGGPANPRSW